MTPSPIAAVTSATTIPAPATYIPSWPSDMPAARITVISELSDMRASAKSVPMRPAAGSSTYAWEGSVSPTYASIALMR